MRILIALCLTVASLASTASSLAGDRENESRPWVAAARIIRNGEQSGAGIYLSSGLIITAAHLTAADATMGVHVAGAVLPASVLKQGAFEDVDLTLLRIDEAKLPTRIALPHMRLCDAPPWPGDRVIVVDASNATSSHILSPTVLPFGMPKFTSLIADVATTGNSGSGVFDPVRKCLLGIMSRKIFLRTPNGEKDLAKYFVPAAEIRAFMPAEFRAAN
jgi:S1-C subfamily serine protease